MGFLRCHGYRPNVNTTKKELGDSEGTDTNNFTWPFFFYFPPPLLTSAEFSGELSLTIIPLTIGAKQSTRSNGPLEHFIGSGDHKLNTHVRVLSHFHL